MFEARQLDDAPLSVPRHCWLEWELAALAILVFAIYFSRLAAAPVCGEESRWANVAREMIATGDWVVPRQQGALFPERPPLGSWAMGLVGLARGEVDLVAVRLPSAIATLLMTLLVYGYARAGMSRFGSFASAAIYATLAQVMVLGRFGESEALFTLWTAGSLLIWHAGYLRRWPMALVWSLGYSLAALGALTKGLQAPVYFVATCTVFLALDCDWRRLFGWGHLAGIACFATIVGAWLIPFSRDGWHAIDDIWAGLAQDRFTLRGLVSHLVSYPFETLGCLLPWSPLLIALLKPSVRQSLGRRRQVKFILVALAVTYPTVWLAAGARGRYFMPLYPCVAVLLGLIVEHCTALGVSAADFAVWRRYARGLAVVVLGGSVALVALGMVPIAGMEHARQPTTFLAAWCVAAAGGAMILFRSSRDAAHARPQAALIAAAALTGLASAGISLNFRIQAGNELAPVVAGIKEQLPSDGSLVSLGKVYHRFAYSYETPIRQVPWPTSAGDLPSDVTYFCFDRRPEDTDDERAGNDDRLGAHTPGRLPFAWEKIADIPCDPVKRGAAHRRVVIGRVRRAELVADPGVNRPVRR